MDFLTKTYDKYFGEHLSLKIRFFNIAIIGGAVTSIPATIASVISGTGLPGILTSAATILFFVVVLIVSQLSKKIDAAIFATIYGLNFLLFPALYFTTGGIQSGAPLYFMIGIIFTVLMMNSKKMIVTIILEIIIFSCVFYLGYAHPEMVATLTTAAGHRDIALDFIIVSLFIAILVKILSVHYKREQLHANELLLKLEDLSIKDPLTSVFNRRFLLKYLESGISRNLENNTPVSIIMFDIDNFKGLNYKYGHIIVDEVLRNLCCIMVENCRHYDIVARYSDEEFVLVLPGAGEETAFKRAEQIRKRVEKATLSESLEGLVTISGGVACFEKTMTSTEEFISVADKYLYSAKKNGRNRVFWNKTKAAF